MSIRLYAMPPALRRVGLWPVLLLVAWLIATAPAAQTSLVFGMLAAAIIVLIVPWLPWIALGTLLPYVAAIRFSQGTPADLLLGGCIVLWAAAGVAKRRLALTNTLPFWAIFVYIVAQLISLTTAVDLGEGLVEVVKWGEFAAILLIVPQAIPQRQVRWLVAGLLIAAAAQGVLGLYQFIYRVGPEWFLIQGRFMRAAGTFRQPNPFAGYLGLTLPLAFSITLWAVQRWWQTRSLTHLLVGIAAGVALGAIGIGLLTSWSRGGWLGALAAVVVVMFLFSPLTRWLTLWGGAVGLVGLMMGTVNPAWIPLGIRSRVADLPAMFGAGDILNQPVTDENFAVIERLAHWVAALRMWESSLWFGVGPGSYNAAYADVALARWPEALGHAHNIYLNVLAESGIIGFIAFCLMWLSLATWIVRQLGDTTRVAAVTEQSRSFTRALGVGCLGMLTHLAVHSFFDNLFVQGIYLHIALWLACFVTLCSMPDHRITASSESRELG